jgi:hypothetical protein
MPAKVQLAAVRMNYQPTHAAHDSNARASAYSSQALKPSWCAYECTSRRVSGTACGARINSRAAAIGAMRYVGRYP